MKNWEKQEKMSEEENIRLLEMSCEERYKIMESWEHDKVMDFLFWMRGYLRKNPEIARREREKSMDYRTKVDSEMYHNK